MMQKLHIFVLVYLAEWKSSEMSHQGFGYAGGGEQEVLMACSSAPLTQKCLGEDRRPHSLNRCLLKSCGRHCPR